MIAMMLRESELLARTDLSSVEFVRMGSAPVSASLMASLDRALPHAAITNAYGTTEAGPVVFGPHPEGSAAAGAVGRLSASAGQARLIDGAGTASRQGELEMKCPALMIGYHNRPELRSLITPDGFYRTGDVFRRDAQRIPFFRRPHRRHVRLRRREHLSRRCRAHAGAAPGHRAGLRRAGRRRDQGPEAGRLHRVRRPARALSEDEVKQFALANAPAYQHPRFVWLLDGLPLASTNKVDRAALKKAAESHLVQQREP